MAKKTPKPTDQEKRKEISDLLSDGIERAKKGNAGLIVVQVAVAEFIVEQLRLLDTQEAGEKP